MEPLAVGAVLDRYRIEGILGEGAAAVVYRVRHTTLNTVHALKVPSIDHPVVLARLVREGRLQAQLVHPHVVRVFDVLDHQGVPCLVLEFVGGGTLADRIPDGGMPRAQVRRLFTQIASGVAAIHARGAVHRDLKPANILLDGDDNAKVADFGLVKADETVTDALRTRPGHGLGTPAYAAPEQAWDAHRVDATADVWALGAVLHTMLTGRPPGDSPDPGQGLLADLARACLAPVPGDRPADAGGLLAQLEPAPTPAEVSPHPASPPTPPEMPAASASGTARALVVDREGVGHVVDVVVELLASDQAEVVTAADVARDTAVAAQVAALWGLGEARHTVRWSVRAPAPALRGTSIGLAVAMATRAAREHRAVPADQAFSGGVDLDGRIAEVGGIPAKLGGALRAGVRRAWVPEGAPSLAGIDVRHAARAEDVATALGLTGRRRPPLRALWLALPVLAAFTQLTHTLDARLQYPVVRAIRGPLVAEHTVVLELPETRDLRALRQRYPDWLRGLATAGATAVVIDVALTAPDDDDESLARAIAEVKADGMEVILPVRFRDHQPVPPGTPALAEAVTLGIVQWGAALDLGWTRRAPARRRTADGTTYWHAAVQAVAAHTGASRPPTLEGDILAAGPTRNPTTAGQLYVHPAEDPPVFPLAEPERWRSEVEGRMVLIGQRTGSEDLHRTPDGPRYGVEVLATLTETLTRQAALRLASPEADALAAAVTGLGTYVLAAFLRRKRRWFAVAVPLGVLSLATALAAAGVLLGLAPIVAAGAIALWARSSDPRPHGV